ncbi:MAG: response regulator transcription factor [Prolixibacteraceae bacterium]|nr:response regulator transcription factor [Prolixibacteraceae bacterium]
MNSIKTILVDDEIEALDSLEFLLSEFHEVKVMQKLTNPVELFSSLQIVQPDLLFLDINMKQISGIELIKQIRKVNQKLPIIFVTAYENYALEALQHHAFDYLLKPVERKKLENTIHNVKSYLNASQISANNILISSNNKSYVLQFGSIVSLTAEGNYTHIELESGEKIIASYNMGNIAKKFPKDFLIRVNRGLMVSRSRIKSIDRKRRTCIYSNGSSNVETIASQNFIREFNNYF